MKNILCICGLMIMVASCDVRRKDTVSANNPLTKQTEIKDPTTVQIIDSAYDFGKVAEGGIVQYNYRFKNTGTKPLVITDATASCGCTVPEKPEQPILPGETGFIKVKFDSKGRVGRANKTITVSSNAARAFPILQLTGEVTEK